MSSTRTKYVLLFIIVFCAVSLIAQVRNSRNIKTLTYNVLNIFQKKVRVPFSEETSLTMVSDVISKNDPKTEKHSTMYNDDDNYPKTGQQSNMNNDEHDEKRSTISNPDNGRKTKTHLTISNEDNYELKTVKEKFVSFDDDNASKTEKDSIMSNDDDAEDDGAGGDGDDDPNTEKHQAMHNDNNETLPDDDNDYPQTDQHSTTSKTKADADVKRCEMKHRLHQLADYCTKHNSSKPHHGKSYPNILVDEKHKLMYCPITKVGSSSLLTLLIHASGKPYGALKTVHDEMGKYDIRQLGSYPEDEIQRKLKEYFKVIVVRHPFDRIVSAWYDKVKLKKTASISRQIIALMDVDEATFPSFVSFMKTSMKHDGHWVTFEGHCNPCDVAWDAILKMETFDVDYDILLDRFGDDINRTTDRIYRNNKRSNGTSHNMSFSRELSEMKLDKIHLDFLYSRYGNDMDMFGYSYDNSSQTAYCGSADTCC